MSEQHRGPVGRPNRVVVDLTAVRANFRALRGALGPRIRIFAPLKANAYGMGLVQVARALEREGVDGLCLVDASAAVRLRQAGVSCPILLYGGNLPDATLLAVVVDHRLLCTIHDRASARLFAGSSQETEAFVKINVGNERFGFLPEEMDELAVMLRGSRCRIVGVYAHPDVPDQASISSYLRWQIDRLEAAAVRLQVLGIEVPVRMAASSRVLLARSDLSLNAVDPGHLMVGLDPGGQRAVVIEQRPALVSVETRVVQVREPADTPYRHEGPIPQLHVKRLAVLPIGSADAVDRYSAACVLIRGRRASILGRFSLEHMRVDVSDVPGVELGDAVVLIGRQGDEEIGLAEVVRHRNLKREVEVTTAIPESITRVYVE